MNPSCLAADAFMPGPAPVESADAELARAAGHGNVAAFESLYRRHVARIHGTILRLVGHDHARAEDLVQETFVRAWRHLDGFRQQSAFATWLHRLAVNTALMSLRAQSSRPLEFHREEELPGNAETPFCPAEREELERAIASLPPRARAVLVLHDVEGWRHADIARELDMAPGTSKAQLHHARLRLRRMLGGES